MTIRNRRRALSAAGAALGCLLLTVCAGQTPTATNWVKAGADDQTIARELADCNAQANAALANEQGINADINATLGPKLATRRDPGYRSAVDAPAGRRLCRPGPQQLHARQGVQQRRLIKASPRGPNPSRSGS